jgi:hypothetical protein
VATSQEPGEETPWGWIAFGILAAAVIIFGIVWWLHRRNSGNGGDDTAPPLDTGQSP